ncbi:MAG TPA: hypothetical protein DCS30_00540 [Rhizobiales bacterium]|nr:hypothetical protein [Hyphomicrobiales bacterium]
MNFRELCSIHERLQRKSADSLDLDAQIIALLNSDFGELTGWLDTRIDTVSFYNKTSIDAVYAVDQNQNLGVWKEPIFSILLANQIVRGGISPDTQILAEAGGVSLAHCLSKFSETFNGDTVFITSRYYPDNLLNSIVNSNLKILRAPPFSGLSIEEEFYKYLVEFVKTQRHTGKIASTWHVKWSDLAGKILAQEMIKRHKEYLEKLDYLVLSIGSGASLSWACELKKYFSNIKIIIAEPDTANLIKNKTVHPMKELESSRHVRKYNDYFISKNERIIHSVFGPHYEKLNGRISSEALQNIDQVITYRRDNWMYASEQMRDIGFSVGNSTAGCFAVAQSIRQSAPNRKVLSVAFEPLKKYALEKNTENHSSTHPFKIAI